jgi:hypothetical protein
VLTAPAAGVDSHNNASILVTTTALFPLPFKLMHLWFIFIITSTAMLAGPTAALDRCQFTEVVPIL